MTLKAIPLLYKSRGPGLPGYYILYLAVFPISRKMHGASQEPSKKRHKNARRFTRAE